jgi:hypothetical protein
MFGMILMRNERKSENKRLKAFLTAIFLFSGLMPFVAQAGDSASSGFQASAMAPTASGDAWLASARCDGESDDAPAINAALAAIRAAPSSGNFGWPIGHAGRLTLPKGKCLIKSTINLSHLYGSGFVADFWGAQIICQTGGRPCLDATGTGQITLLGLNVYGDCAVNTPLLGLVLARTTESLSAGADHVYLDHPTIAGCFTLADFYNRSSETTMINGGAFYNYRDHAYAAIWDGSNVFNFQSEFQAQHYADGKYSSFDENTCETCLFEVFGKGSTALWLGGAVRHKFINGYVLSQNAEGAPAILLSFENNMPNDFLDLNIHFENRSIGSLILIKGAAHPVIHSLHLNDPRPFQSGPIFKREKGVETVTIQDADFHIGALGGVRPTWWDDKAAYNVSGMIYSQDKTYEDPARMSGLVCVQSKCAMH